MELTGPIFVFFVLPLGFLAQRAAPPRFKNAVLLLLSVGLIAWGSPYALLLIALHAAFQYFTARQMAALKRENRTRRLQLAFAAGVAADLALLVFYKYTGPALTLFGAKGLSLPAAPLGISFYTFSAISLLADVYRGTQGAPQSYLETALYLSFFPKFVSGPIVPYSAFARQLHTRVSTPSKTAEGFMRFAVGLAKKTVLAGALSGLFAEITALPMAGLTAAHAWLGVLLYAFELYFDFSGYSDMAIGIAGTCGFTFDENFMYPYLSAGVSEFWRRWHISLGRWFRDYVYIPLGGSRRGDMRTARNIAAVWLLTGLWHGANFTFVVWGAYHALLILAEKFLFADLKRRLPKAVNIALTFLFVILGWVPFFSESLSYAGGYVCRLFGVGGAGLYNGGALFLLGESALWLALAAIGATPLPGRVANKLKDTRLGAPLSAVAAAALLILSAAAMVGGGLSSFLYAQF